MDDGEWAELRQELVGFLKSATDHDLDIIEDAVQETLISIIGKDCPSRALLKRRALDRLTDGERSKRVGAESRFVDLHSTGQEEQLGVDQGYQIYGPGG